MDIFWSLVLVGLGSLAWIGQTLARFAPSSATRLGLVEAESSVEAVYWADIRGEALWDALTLWTLPLAGVLLVAGAEAWVWLGLVGGGIYVYFGGRGIATRLEMQRRGFSIGAPANVRLGLAMLAVWTAVGLVTIGAAVVELS